MSMQRMPRPHGTKSPGRNWPRLLPLLFCLGSLAWGLVSPSPGRAQADAKGPEVEVTGLKRYRMPAIMPAQFTAFATDSVRAWARSAALRAGDRAALFAAVRDLFRMDSRFADRVAKTYPKNELEWITITDRAADSLAVRLGPVLEAYGKAYPEELLSAGRVAYEERMAQIVGPPSRMLGFHLTMLGGYAVEKADSILAAGKVADVAGVQDGVLRSLQDWYHLYDEAHRDVVERHLSQMNQEDWILVRLEDRCGNKGNNVWEMKDMFVAIVGRDSTRTPPQNIFAHQYTIVSKKCAEDERIIYLDMPLYVDAQLEFYRRSPGTEGEIPEELKKTPR
jgi:hypothetical protein